jgi:signal transduction histidine kinase
MTQTDSGGTAAEGRSHNTARLPDPRPLERFAPLDAHHRLLEEYAPPSLVVTEAHAVVHMSSGAARYLQLSAGEPSRDLLKLVRPELRVELRTALYQAAKDRTSVEVGNVAVAVDGHEERIDLIVRPVLREDEPGRGFFLVLFASRDGDPGPPRSVRPLEATVEPIARQLEEELARVKAQLRTTIEQHEAQAEEALRLAQVDLDQRVAERTRDLETAITDHQSAQLHVVNLLRKVVTAQEDERGRIARNLHDQLGQRLTALRLSLERVQERLTGQARRDDDLDRALDLTHKLDADVGFLSWELRPAVLDHLGLGVALPRYVREWADHYGVEVQYKGDSFQPGLLSREAEVALYRIAQEALTNVAKHAHASRVDIMLESHDEAIVLVVEDDGVGFDPEDGEIRERGIGLIGMRERAGLIGADFQLESKVGDGTSIFVRHSIAAAAAPRP